MDASVVARLLDVIRQFYQSEAASFSATRGRANPGVARLLAAVPAQARVLDLGCGNGSAAAVLAGQGFAGEYLGLDASAGLLAAARARDLGAQFHFTHADLTAGWGSFPTSNSQLPLTNYDFIFCFATLHHLPGHALRVSFLEQVRTALAPAGRFFHSNWQFLNSPKLAARVQPWAAAGLSDAEVDPGDYLLDWRGSSPAALRYVHHFTEKELAALATQTGFTVLETFLEDGATADLGLYSVWGQPQ